MHCHKPSAEFYAMLERLDMSVLNICVVDKHERGYEDGELKHRQMYEVYRGCTGRAPWCSTFDPEDWESPGFAERAIARLEETFRKGAVAVKIYKSIGQELKSRDGWYLMPDHGVFDPIFQFLAARDITLMAHIADPIGAWRPLVPGDPNYGYFKNTPAWHRHRFPERPSKETILAARDHMLSRHPRLRVVGVHLGSMEDDVAEIAKRFDLYPNFAVDTAARVHYLMVQPRQEVREFLIKYQDRVLYGTDLGMYPWGDAGEAVKRMEELYARDWKLGSCRADGDS
jgi:predicted TIM-barrel fold metal-dependent hydrolase